MYSRLLLEHFEAPRNRGRLPNCTGSGEARFDQCGDRMRLEVRIEENQILDCAFEAYGCGAAVAAGSAGTELIRGRSVEEARQVTAFDLDRALGGVPPAKRHALLMFLECLAQAVAPREDETAGGSL